VVEAKYGSVRGGWRSRDIAGSHGLGYAGLLVGIGIVFQVTPNLFQEMVLESVLGRSCGVVIRLLRRLSRGCIT
jgi:hypothetical protein